MLQELKGRSEYIDFVKAIGICLVVLGHTFGGGLFALKTYHMPLFFFLAGLLFKDEDNIKEYVKNRVRRLYIPFLLYEIFFLFIHNFLYNLGILSDCYSFPGDYLVQIVHIVCFDNCETLLSPIWFVTAMFFSGIICKIIISFFKKRNIIFIFVISILLIYVGMLNGRSNIFYVKFSINCHQIINVSFVAIGYMLMGYLFKKFSPAINIKATYWGRAIIVLAWVGLIFWERKTRLVSDMRANAYTYISLAPLFAFIGISMIFLVAQCVLRIVERVHLNRVKMLILYTGQHTFTIMCLHPLAFKLIGLIQVNFFGYDKQLLLDWGVVGYDAWWLALDSVAGILIPLVGTVCLKSYYYMVSKGRGYGF